MCGPPEPECGPQPACFDTLDNDSDSLSDFPSDPGCAEPLDDSETNDDCSDAIDNDHDGLIDADDPGCENSSDTSERSPLLACDDGYDNDLDGRIDFLPSGAPALPNLGDPGCQTPGSSRENPQCQDGIDNDEDGTIDFDGGDSVDLDPQDGFIDQVFNPSVPPTSVGAIDPQCTGRPYRDSETQGEIQAPALGGAGIASLLAVLSFSGMAAAHRMSHNRRTRKES